MYRLQIINSIIRTRGYQSYLEVGVDNPGRLFNHVRCRKKVGVDPNPNAVRNKHSGCSSDEFFLKNKQKFDVIFIDGMHEELQVDKDIKNSLNCLSPGGVIILHDSLPPDEWAQRPHSQFKPGQCWFGTVWRSVLKYFYSSPYRCYVVDEDCGCSIIDTANQASHPHLLPLPSDLNYQRDFGLLKSFAIGAGQFEHSLDEIKIFYQITCFNNWREVVEEQLSTIQISGLYRGDIRTSVNGTEEDAQWVVDLAAQKGIRVILESVSPNLEVFECHSIYAIEEWAHSGATGSVLYLHTKGISHPENLAIWTRWRWFLMDECVMNWDRCFRKLQSHDVVGANWRAKHRHPHFSGNIWWANASWIRKLPNFTTYFHQHLGAGRYNCERWIGAGKSPKIHSFPVTDVSMADGKYLFKRFPKELMAPPYLTKQQ